MAAIYSNFKQGTLSASTGNNPATDTTLTSVAFQNLPVVSSPDVIYIVLDPGQVAGAAEIVAVTAHTNGSQSVTVTRAQQTTAIRSHASGTTWSHAWTKADADLMPHRVLTTKGDLLVGTGSNNIDRLPIGTNTYALVADSAQTLGVKWAPAASSVSSLTDVTLSSLSANDHLRYDGTTSKWINTSAGVMASLTVSGNLTVDTTTLFVDSTNNWVGIGTASPASVFHVVSSSGGAVRFAGTATQGSIGTGNDAHALRLSGGIPDDTNVGGNIYLYGTSHATVPNAVVLQSQGTERLRVDATNTSVTGALAVSGTITLSGSQPQISLTHGTANTILFGNATVAAPTFTSRSAGTRLVLWSAIGASAAEYALGVETNNMWFSVDTTSSGYKWYSGTTNTMTLSGAGTLAVTGSVYVNNTAANTVVFAAGGDATARGVYIDNIAPTGGSDGDIWLRYA